MQEQTLTLTETEVTEQVVEVRQFFGWAHQAHERCKESFVTITCKKTHPYPGCPGFRKLWKIGGVVTQKSYSNLSDCEPVVGEVVHTVEDEVIEIVTVDYI